MGKISFRTLCLVAAMSLPSIAFADCADAAFVDGSNVEDTISVENENAYQTVADSAASVQVSPVETKYVPLASENAQTYKDTKYWKRHNKYKTLGWTFLGVGVPALVASYFVFTSDGNSNNESESVMQAVGSIALVGVGGALTIASIPMFVLSHKNARKAKKLDVGVTMMAEPEGFAKKPGISLALTF